MSIITEALNRLQAERARRSGRTPAWATTEPAEDPEFRDPDGTSPSLRFRGKRSRPLLIVLGSVGIASVLWSLFLLADPDGVSPGRETERESEPVQPAELVEVISEQREIPFAEPNDDVHQMESGAASVHDLSAKPPSAVAQETPARQVRASPPLSSSPEPRPGPRVVAAPSGQRPTRVPPRLRHATPVQRKLARAQSFIKERQYARAVAVLEPLLVEPPHGWEPWFWLGTAQLGLGQWEKAQASLVEGLARDATVPYLWVQRALASQQQGRFGEAVDFLRQAELLAPMLPEVHLNLAYSLEMLGERRVAIEHYRTFLTLSERHPAYHDVRKKVLAHVGQLKHP